MKCATQKLNYLKNVTIAGFYEKSLKIYLVTTEN